MRIDPKNFTFDALERAQLILALEYRLGIKKARVSSLAKSKLAGTDKCVRNKQETEIEIARIEDMLETLKGVR